MNLSDFDYHLPKELIAQTPLAERDRSKLMVLGREDGRIEDHRFFELPDLLDENSVLVMNESRVIPARIQFKLGNGKAEILLIKPRSDSENVWECMARPGNKFPARAEAHSGGGPKAEIQIDSELTAYVKEVMENGLRVIHFACDDLHGWLAEHGKTPTPPYIKTEVEDPERYQTVYAKTEGSVAAPTAGLHFTPEVFEGLKARGIGVEKVTLHVGLGTFQPVKTEKITQHQLHSEWFSLEPETARRLNEAKYNGKKIVAVGTTSVRVLESCAGKDGFLEPQSGETDIFIYPGYRWKMVDQLITNFHVPKSSLLMLVSAFAQNPESDNLLEGRDFILKAYQKAKDSGYRFFSFGDAMLIK